MREFSEVRANASSFEDGSARHWSDFSYTTIVLLIGLLFGVSPPVLAQVDLTDQRDGMTCVDYSAAISLAWQHPGGDWRDANDLAQGNEPFVRRTISRSKERQLLEWDVTELVRIWQAGGEPSGGIYLRQLADPGSSVKFHSRESGDPTARPRLSIDLDDGAQLQLTPSADTTMTCTSYSGKGTSRSLEVGNDRSAVLVFPFDGGTQPRVRRARLILVSDKQYGGTSDIGLFRLFVPSSVDQPARHGIAKAYDRDAGIRAHPSVVFATGFDFSNWLDDWSEISRSSVAERVVSDDGNGFAPFSGSALKVTIEKGKKQGLNLLYRFQDKMGSEPDAMYFRYYLRFGRDWAPHVSGKMPGFAGTYGRAGWGGRKPDGTDGWSARGGYTVSSALGKEAFSLGSYVYHAGLNKKYGDGWGWNIGTTGVLEKNRWYGVEQYLKLNDPGKDNGVLQAWIDGQLVFDRRDIRFRDTDALRIEALWMNVYHGGTTKASSDISLYIDNLVIAREYIGPAGGGAPVD